MARPNGNNQPNPNQTAASSGPRFHCTFAGCAFGAQKSFKKEIFLKQHLLNCHSERNYRCPTCCKAFAIDWQLKYHQRTCGIDWACLSCNRVYKERLSLITHCKRHSHELPSGAILRKPKKSDAKAGTSQSNGNVLGNQYEQRPKKKGKGTKSKSKQQQQQQQQQQQHQQEHQALVMSHVHSSLGQTMSNPQLIGATQQLTQIDLQGHQLHQLTQLQQLQPTSQPGQQQTTQQSQQLTQHLLPSQCHLVNGQCTIQLPAQMIYTANSLSGSSFVIPNLPSNVIQVKEPCL